jgi:hypothetical protein
MFLGLPASQRSHQKYSPHFGAESQTEALRRRFENLWQGIEEDHAGHTPETCPNAYKNHGSMYSPPPEQAHPYFRIPSTSNNDQYRNPAVISRGSVYADPPLNLTPDQAQQPESRPSPLTALSRQNSFKKIMDDEVAAYKQKKTVYHPLEMFDEVWKRLKPNTETENKKSDYQAFSNSLFNTKGKRIKYNVKSRQKLTIPQYRPNLKPQSVSRRSSFETAVHDEVRELQAQKNKLDPETIGNNALKTINTMNSAKAHLTVEKASEYLKTLFKTLKKRTQYTPRKNFQH